MCGIAGLISKAPASEDCLAAALASMRRRGPDGEGVFQGALGGACLTLLHTRLSILDLDPRSDQPFRKDGMTLVYNGEIYNFQALRRELSALGARFQTEGDTEVVLEAYRHWGTAAFDRLEGMWALALHDASQGRFVLSRDRFGEKPLYLWREGGAVAFASEIKTLSRLMGKAPRVNGGQVRRFLVNGYKGLYRHGETFFTGIAEFPPGHFAIFDGATDPGTQAYWALRYQPDETMTAEDAQRRSRELVDEAVQSRLVSDVPVAIRLSGGIDSNVIAGVALKRLGADIRTFSVIDDDPRYDETGNILKAVQHFGCPHDLVRIPQEGFVERLEKLVGYFDGPPMTISYYLHALVSEAIHNAGYKVALGGTAADEIFTGYYDHYLFWLATQHDRPDFEELVAGWRNSYGRFVRNPHLQDPRAFIDRPAARDHIFLDAARFSAFLIEPFDEPHGEAAYTDDILRNRMLNELFVETVPVMLHEDDLASMAFSVENRAPFLHRPLVEFLFTVPTRHLIQDGLPKFLLRAAAAGVADPDILANPRKQGINAPVSHFLDLRDPAIRDWILGPSPLFDYIDRQRLAELLASDVAVNSESKFLFSCLAAKIFLEQHAGGGGEIL